MQSLLNPRSPKLISRGCISQVPELPKVVNPLTVAGNKEKFRLVLDCRHINPHLHKFRFKYEDAVEASHMFEKGDYLFTYDLRSAYHHIEIFEDHKTYLGFSWFHEHEKVTKYYVFNVLPFGISTAGYIFTKVVRCIVKYLRDQGLQIIMYTDDGIGGASEISKANFCSLTVRYALRSAGFLIAEEKCSWEPSQSVTWLGLVWDMKDGIVYVTETRLNKLKDTLNVIIQSDASGIGFGGYAVSISDTEVMGSWNSVESLKSSTWRELEAVYRVLLSLLVTLQGETIKWYTDNQNIVYIIKQGSKKGDLQLIAFKIANVCKLNNIVLLPQWVPREENSKADQISKSVDCDDWGIDPEVYSVLDNL
ncbi:Hypothetical predicted protein [Mytilus galloprovincialis]|uniref:Reverse transcriptase domain-containing protein n=1 Tax=Mytilus galloprovincialis TaxID=29158 RepID=A0A8B6GZG0_MYTGA|nr:Hypothetical predicted protein [Mytilus galloprovincialis]